MILGQLGGSGSLVSALAFPALMIGVMYFLLIRPQQQQAKKAAAFRAALKVGDTIVTAGGILGTVVELDVTVATVEVSPKVRVRFLRSQIVAQQTVAVATTDAAPSEA